MKIRYMAPEDEAAVYAILCELEGIRLDQDKFHVSYVDYLEDPKMHCLAAEEDGQITGVLNLRIGTMLCRTGKIGEIVELSVKSGQRSNGIGHELFQKACSIARDADCVRFEVSSNNTRKGAHRFYEREGMVKSHSRFVQYF